MDRGLAVSADRVRGRADRAAGADQLVLGKAVGTWQAALVSFAIGTLLLAGIVAVASGGFGGRRGAPRRWYRCSAARSRRGLRHRSSRSCARSAPAA